MHFLIRRIEKLSIGWNKRPLGEAEFYRLCKRFRVHVEEMPLRVSGFYYCVMGRHFIAIDSKLPPQRKIFVMFHELGHFLLHVPEADTTANFHSVGRRTRKEIEADAFALCALIPGPMIENRSPDELISEDGFSSEMIDERRRIFERHGI
jgi:Zn-dependent peptidase ImmA (M78 family)